MAGRNSPPRSTSPHSPRRQALRRRPLDGPSAPLPSSAYLAHQPPPATQHPAPSSNHHAGQSAHPGGYYPNPSSVPDLRRTHHDQGRPTLLPPLNFSDRPPELYNEVPSQNSFRPSPYLPVDALDPRYHRSAPIHTPGEARPPIMSHDILLPQSYPPRPNTFRPTTDHPTHHHPSPGPSRHPPSSSNLNRSNTFSQTDPWVMPANSDPSQHSSNQIPMDSSLDIAFPSYAPPTGPRPPIMSHDLLLPQQNYTYPGSSTHSQSRPPIMPRDILLPHSHHNYTSSQAMSDAFRAPPEQQQQHQTQFSDSSTSLDESTRNFYSAESSGGQPSQPIMVAARNHEGIYGINKTVDGRTVREYTCERCPRTFARPSTLVQHRRKSDFKTIPFFFCQKKQEATKTRVTM